LALAVLVVKATK
jgi:hypothetical protein